MQQALFLKQELFHKHIRKQIYNTTLEQKRLSFQQRFPTSSDSSPLSPLIEKV